MKSMIYASAALLLMGAGCSPFQDRPPAEPITVEPIVEVAPQVQDPHGPEAKADLITVSAPVPGSQIGNPLTVTGKARGPWYFEASFPVKLLDSNGTQLALKPAQAQGEWMTTDFVPFTVTLTYPTPATATGTLILMKDNPSGEAQFDDFLTIPVIF